MNRRDFINNIVKVTAVGIVVPDWMHDPMWGKSQVVSGGVPFTYVASFWEKVKNTWPNADFGEMIWHQSYQYGELMPGERMTIKSNQIRDLTIKHEGNIGGLNIVGDGDIYLQGCDFSNINGSIDIGHKSEFKEGSWDY